MKPQWLLPVVLLTAVALSGCLGGGSDKGKPPELQVITDTMQLSGSQQGLAQAKPQDIYVDIPIKLDYEKVIKIQINITVEDGDANTNPDTVGQMELKETPAGGEGNTTTINGGNTPINQTVVVEWQNGAYLSSSWKLHIPVTIKGGDDTWPGPFIWKGVPDRGFSYTLDITYEYHEAPAQG